MRDRMQEGIPVNAETVNRNDGQSSSEAGCLDLVSTFANFKCSDITLETWSAAERIPHFFSADGNDSSSDFFFFVIHATFGEY